MAFDRSRLLNRCPVAFGATLKRMKLKKGNILSEIDFSFFYLNFVVLSVMCGG